MKSLQAVNFRKSKFIWALIFFTRKIW